VNLTAAITLVMALIAALVVVSFDRSSNVIAR
jgi:hypothetical protein